MPKTVRMRDATVKTALAAHAPYGDWARDGLVPFSVGQALEMPPSPDDLLREQALRAELL